MKATPFAYLLLLFCLGPAFRISGQQDPTILSKRPLVTKTVSYETKETTITAYLIDPQSDAFTGALMYSPNYTPPDLRLQRVEYSYPGTVAARPQAVAFVLFPREKHKDDVAFSITADGTVVHEGSATPKELCCVTVNGHSANPQHIVATVPIEIFERLTQAGKVELKLTTKRGKFSFKLNDYQRKAITALADTIK